MAIAFKNDSILSLRDRAKFRDPDRLTNAAEELRLIVPSYQKISGARAIAHYIEPNRNRSVSFRVFIEGVLRMATL